MPNRVRGPSDAPQERDRARSRHQAEVIGPDDEAGRARSSRGPGRWAWPVAGVAVVAAGIALRAALFAATPPTLVDDGHLDAILEAVRTNRPADPSRFFQGYHPPLYQLSGAAAYRAIAGREITDETWALRRLGGVHGQAAAVAFARQADTDPAALPAQPDVARPLARHRLALRAIQGISLLASIGALLLGWPLLRLFFPGRGAAFLAGLALLALLPRAIYQAAVTNNEALVALWAALTVYLLARFLLSPAWRWALTAGAACGLALLTKGTGLALLPAAAAALAVRYFHLRRRDAAEARRVVSGGVLILAMAVAIGAPHYARMGARYGHPFITNADSRLLAGSTHLKDKPPGSGLRILDARPLSLWRHVFVHASTVASWPTAIYASFWYDHEAVFTLWRYPGARAHVAACRPPAPAAGAAPVLWSKLLDWPVAAESPPLVRQGRWLYAAGFPVTLLTILGAVALGAYHRSGLHALVGALWLGSAALLLLLSIRTPTFCSFKAAYMLVSVPALAVFAARGAEAVRLRMGLPGLVLAAAAGLGLTLADVRHFGYLATSLAGAPSVWEMESKFFDPNLRAAQELLAQGRAGEAEGILRFVAEIRPESPLPWESLGDARRARGDLAAAVGYYRKAISLAEGEPGLVERLTRTVERLEGPGTPPGK